MSEMSLAGKVALITGGASGIGLAIAKAYASQGAKVVVGSRTLEKVQGAVDQINQDTSDSCDGVSLDVTSDDSIQSAVDYAVDRFGGLHILVNSAGVMCKKPALQLTRDDVNNIVNTNLTGSLKAAQSAAKVFTEKNDKLATGGAGCIINIASVTSFMDLVGVMAYAMTKSGVMGLTRGLANEWAEYGIRTNAIAPGFVPTDINRKMIEGTDRGRRIIEHTPMSRFGTGDEMAGAAIYLASDSASFTNGVTIPVDGGYLISGIGNSEAEWGSYT